MGNHKKVYCREALLQFKNKDILILNSWINLEKTYSVTYGNLPVIHHVCHPPFSAPYIILSLMIINCFTGSSSCDVYYITQPIYTPFTMKLLRGKWSHKTHKNPLKGFIVYISFCSSQKIRMFSTRENTNMDSIILCCVCYMG